jgi:hypothetical protein
MSLVVLTRRRWPATRCFRHRYGVAVMAMWFIDPVGFISIATFFLALWRGGELGYAAARAERRDLPAARFLVQLPEHLIVITEGVTKSRPHDGDRPAGYVRR